MNFDFTDKVVCKIIHCLASYIKCPMNVSREKIQLYIDILEAVGSVGYSMPESIAIPFQQTILELAKDYLKEIG